MEIGNSTRVILTASYAMTKLTPEESRRASGSAGGAMRKLNYFRSLGVSGEELARLRHLLGGDPGPGIEDVLAAVQRLSTAGEGGLNSKLASAFAKLDVASILGFTRSLASFRGDETTAVLGLAFSQQQAIAPVGRLHLERLEMSPAGIEKGELVFTIPIAPSETITVSHKEWSTSSEEYSSLVTDSFESYSEKGVAEKTDVSMASENESQHSNSFTFGASVSGGYAGVTVSTNLGLSSSSQDRGSVKQSATRNKEVTAKASARSRQEHKVSVKLETKKGVEDSSFRTITNPHDDRALRIDFSRMMRKWRTDLLRYGLRLTFDIVVPNPGERLWDQYRKLEALEAQLRQPMDFTLKPDDLTDTNWLTYATQYQADVEPPPPASLALTASRSMSNPSGGIESFEFVAPEGYLLGSKLSGRGIYTGAPGPDSLAFAVDLISYQSLPTPISGGGGFTVKLTGGLFGAPRSTVFAAYAGGMVVSVELEAVAHRTQTLFDAWRVKAWAAIQQAAAQGYGATIARLQARRDELSALLTGKDTLTLRRMEREELLHAAVEWLIGPGFTSAPKDVAAVVTKILAGEDQADPDAAGGTDLTSVSQKEWGVVLSFGEFVKFIHQAVEWENLLYFLYPYFWGSANLAREKLLFDHPDPNHRDFLRAGFARLVLPIRPGFEQDFTSLLETGSLGQTTAPYMTIADEVSAFARTNYAGIPPANPEAHARPLLYPQQRTTWDTMQGVVRAIEDYRDANGAYPDDLSALPGAPFLDAWGRDLVYKLPGSGNDYDLFSLGADGVEGGEGVDADISAGASASLIASWFEYTPTSGLDIDLNAKLEDIA